MDFQAFWEKLARMQDEEEIGVFLTDCISNLYLKQASRTVYRNFILKTKSYAREHMSDGNPFFEMDCGKLFVYEYGLC